MMHEMRIAINESKSMKDAKKGQKQTSGISCNAFFYMNICVLAREMHKGGIHEMELLTREKHKMLASLNDWKKSISKVKYKLKIPKDMIFSKTKLRGLHFLTV